MTSLQQYPMIAKTMAELEDVLAEELTALGANDVEIGTRMVSFSGDKALMYKANLHCRTALRILKPIHTFKAATADEVYEAVKNMDWEQYMSLDSTFSIDAVVFSHIFTHSKFVAYKVKDAIADWFYEKYEKRPSVSVTNPDLVFNIHVAHNKCTLSLDSSGESLHKRGYRVAQGDAPLSEVLAAGMVLKSGWRGESTFVDPMCGSGTLLIEAAMIALGIPPGIHRPSFGFEKWNDFDEELFSEIYNDDSSSREFSHQIIGSDISPKMIAIAEKNIKNAGLKNRIELSTKPLQQYTEPPAQSGILMTNPPYGERLKVEDLHELYSMIGERLKHVFAGYNAYVLSYRKENFDSIGLKHNKRFFLFNGALECEMREYEIFAGKRDERPKSQDSNHKKRRDSEHYERNSKEGYRRSKRREEADSEQEGGSRPKREFNRQERPRTEFRRERSSDDKNARPRREFYGKRESDDREKPRREFNRDRSDDKPFRQGERSFDGERKSDGFKKRGFEKGGERKFENKKRAPKSGDKPFGEKKIFRKRDK